MEDLLVEVVEAVEDVKVQLDPDQLLEELVVEVVVDTLELLELLILEAAVEVVEELILDLDLAVPASSSLPTPQHK
jgi:hypothetical protein